MQSQRKAIAMTYEMEKDDFDYWQHPLPISQIRKQVIYLFMEKNAENRIHQFIDIWFDLLFLHAVLIPLHKDLLYIIQAPDKSSILTLHWIDWQFIISQSCSRPSWPLYHQSYPRKFDICQSATEAITAACECEVVYFGNPLTTDCSTAHLTVDR